MAISADALPADFVAAMNDDINVSGASAAIFTAIRSGNTLLSKLADRADSDVAKAEVREALVNVRAMLDTLGLDPLAEPWVSDGAAGGAAGAGADSAEHDALDKLVSEPAGGTGFKTGSNNGYGQPKAMPAANGVRA